MLKKIKLDNYVTFIKPTEIEFSATNYKFLEKKGGNMRNLRIGKKLLLTFMLIILLFCGTR